MMQRITVPKTFATIAFAVAFILLISDKDCAECYSAQAMQLRLVIAGIVTVAIAVYSTLRYKKFENMAFDIANQPLLETNEATVGVSFSGEGMLVTDAPLSSPYTNTPCVYYHTILEKRVGSGKDKKWVVQQQDQQFALCYLQDERGRLAIDITGVDSDNSGASMKQSTTQQIYSEIDCEGLLKKESCTPDGESGKWRRSEYVLQPNSQVFVYGYVDRREQGHVLIEHEREPLIISRKSQQEFIAAFQKGSGILFWVYPLVLGGLGMLVGAVLWAGFISYPIAMGVTVVSIALFMLHGVMTLYNRIIVFRNRALNSLSNIEGELKRRYDLIPNLNHVVSQYAAFEREAHGLIASLRAASVSDPFVGAIHTTAHTDLRVLVEAYPELKASETVTDLMTALTDTEERIAYSRTFYNAAAAQYNTAVQQFPTMILTALLGLRPMRYIGVSTGA